MKRLYVSYLVTSSRLEPKLHERKGSGISEFDKLPFSQCLVLFQAGPKPKYKAGPCSISTQPPLLVLPASLFRYPSRGLLTPSIVHLICVMGPGGFSTVPGIEGEEASALGDLWPHPAPADYPL